MSIATMTRLAADATVQDDQLRGGDLPEARPGSIGGSTVTSRSDPKSTVQTALDAIAAYFPSEALAVYVAALGIMQPASDGERWIWFLVGVLSVVLFTVLGGLDREVRVPWGRLVTVMLIALVSFSTYAASLPGTPFLSIHPQATAVAGVIAIIFSLALPRVARILRLAPE